MGNINVDIVCYIHEIATLQGPQQSIGLGFGLGDLFLITSYCLDITPEYTVFYGKQCYFGIHFLQF